MIVPADLKSLELFADLELPDLEWLAPLFEERVFESGEVAFPEQSAAREMYGVIEGGMEARQNGKAGVWFTLQRGEIGGVMPYSRMKVYPSNMCAVGHTRLCVMPDSRFLEMLSRLPQLGFKFAHVLIDRSRESLNVRQQQEKMVALGKLSAGLAHELNNPAAAVRRTSGELRLRFRGFPRVMARVLARGLSKEQIRYLSDLHLESREKPILSTVKRSKLEDEIADWLGDHAVIDAYDLAPTLVSSGILVSELDAWADCFSDDALPDVLRYLEWTLGTEQMLAEVESASDRISGLVGSVKGYTHMDSTREKGPTQVKEGLESTLTMLGYQLKQKNIGVERDYAEDLPPALGFGGELNQVWTNLIANAIEAMDPGGTLRLEAHPDGDGVRVSVIDNGRGIPPDLLERIFEPFFTTKDVGEGTGMGLDLARSSVVRTHNGKLEVQSSPGRTEFRVLLPGVPEPEDSREQPEATLEEA